MKWFPMPQAVLRSKWDVHKEPKHMRTSINLSFGLWQTLVVAHPRSNSSTPTPSCLLAPPFSSNDHRMCLRKACPQPQLQGYFLVHLSQWQWSHFPCHDLDVGTWSKSAPMRWGKSAFIGRKFWCFLVLKRTQGGVHFPACRYCLIWIDAQNGCSQALMKTSLETKLTQKEGRANRWKDPTMPLDNEPLNEATLEIMFLEIINILIV